MDNVVSATPPAPASSSPSRHRPGAGALTLVKDVLADVGSVYVGTRSALITVIAAAVAVVLVMMVLAFQR